MNIQELNQFSGMCFLLGGLFLVISILLFFTLRIYRVVSYFSGNAEKKAIARIHQGSQNRASKSIRLNGRIDMKRLGASGVKKPEENRATEILQTYPGEKTELLFPPGGQETEVLAKEGSGETELLLEKQKTRDSEYQVLVELGSSVESEIIR